MDIRALNAFMSQVQPPQMQGPSQYTGQSSVLANLGAGMAPRFDNMAGNRDASEIEQLIRGMAALKAQAAQAQVPQAVGQPERFGGREAQTVGIVAALAAALGANPQVTGQAVNNFANVRQGQFNQDWQTRVQGQQAQAAQRLADIQGKMYEAEGQFNVVDRRENNRAARRSERLKVEGQRADQQFKADEAERDRTSREKIAEMRTPGEKIEDLMLRFGLNQADATEMLAVIDAKQTAAKRGLLGAQAGDLQSKTKERDTLLPERVNLIKSQVGVNDERAKKLAVETELLPEATAIAYSRLDLAWQQFAENARQFNTREGRMAGDAAKAEVNKSLTEFNAEVKTFEGEVRKAQEAAMAQLGVTELPDGSPGSMAAFNKNMAAKYAQALAILAKGDTADPYWEWATKTKQVVDALRRQRQGLQQAYDKRNAIKEEMETVPPFDPMGGGASIVGPGGKQFQPGAASMSGNIGR